MPDDQQQPAVPAAPEMGNADPAPTHPTLAPAVKDWEAEALKWQAMSRKNEEMVKANSDAARRLKEIEDRDLSELQKAQRDREDALAEVTRIKSEAEQLRASDLRKQVAIDKGLPATLLGRLQGNTAEELSADADALLALLNTPRTPQPDLGQGPRQVSQQSAEDAEYAAYRAALFPTNQ